MRILITGANGHIGRRLIRRLNNEAPETEVVALVRSNAAAARIRQDALKADIHIIDYQDAAGIRVAGDGCDAIVHLVGIIKESKRNSFEMAHVAACQALVSADLPVSQIICLGILGSSLASDNACFRSRAQAEQILLKGPVPATVLRVPMVLGPEDYASMALASHAHKRFVFTFRGASLEQPVYSEDVIDALLAVLDLEPEDRILELAGPESLTRQDLIAKAGACYGNNPSVISIPISLGYAMASVLEVVSANPPVTRAMLGVLDHDDQIEVATVCDQLGISLTALDEVLKRTIMSR